jgi:pimeloyl-ACP methyl ester carboxylesterase
MGEPIHLRVLGEGTPLLLVHGGVGPQITWELQEPLAERWKLLIPARRGYPPSPPAERQDFEVDALDIETLLEAEPVHVVGFSYGGLGLTVAAARKPERIRSLALIEVPLFAFAPHDPDIAKLISLADAYTSPGGPRDPAKEEAFESLAGVPTTATPALATELERVRRLARGLRQPQEARPRLEAIVDAGIPTIVFSGGHTPGLEAICDAIAERLHARRECLPGAGHAVQRAPGFNARLEAFLRRSGNST